LARNKKIIPIKKHQMNHPSTSSVTIVFK